MNRFSTRSGANRMIPPRIAVALTATSRQRLELFELTGLEDADVAVFPQSWELAIREPEVMCKARVLAKAAARQNKPMLVFFCSDLVRSCRYRQCYSVSYILLCIIPPGKRVCYACLE